MRFAGNFFSEWQGNDSHRTLLAAFVACAVGATACAAVVLSMVSSPTTQTAVSSNSPRAIVRNAGVPEATQSAQDHPMAETPSRAAGRLDAATVTSKGSRCNGRLRSLHSIPLFDVIVMSRRDAHESFVHNRALYSGLFESGRPILLAPPAPPPQIGTNV